MFVLQRGRDSGRSCVSSSLCRQMFSPPTPDLGLPCLNVIRIRVQATGSETKLDNLVRIGLQPNLSFSLLFHLLPECESCITCSRCCNCGCLLVVSQVPLVPLPFTAPAPSCCGQGCTLQCLGLSPHGSGHRLVRCCCWVAARLRYTFSPLRQSSTYTLQLRITS